MTAIYKYIGAPKPSIPSNKFVPSVFQKNGDPNCYLQIDEVGTIAGFKMIQAPGKIHRIEENLEVKTGDDVIYSFITSSGELLYGNRKVIEPRLLELLMSELLNSHAKLIIAKFLNLFGKVIDYVQQSNRDLKRKGIDHLIDEDVIFQNTVSSNEVPQNLSTLIVQRYDHLNKINSTIGLDDVIFIYHDNAYFQNHKFEIDKFFTKSTLHNPAEKNVITQVINLCGKRNKIDIEKLINSNDDTYEFLLLSAAVSLEQKKIEGLLSDKVNETENSVIDIGLRVDKKLSEHKVAREMTRTTRVRDRDKEMALIESFTSITGCDPEVLNFT